MPSNYDPAYTSAFYDAYAEREWTRLESSPSNKANFHVHNHYLQRFVKPGDHVLDAGAGPGRFTLELARIGARVTVGDISAKQIELNKSKLTEAGLAASVAGWHTLDIADLSIFPAAAFDAVMCYGGPLSYVFERAEIALGELLRVTKPGGYLLLSVMSLAGTMRAVLPQILELPLTVNQRVLASGDLDASMGPHRCHMFRWAELEQMLERQPCTIVAVSAANFVSAGNDAALQKVAADLALWTAFLDWEVKLSAESGAIDGGTHIIVVVQKN